MEPPRINQRLPEAKFEFAPAVPSVKAVAPVGEDEAEFTSAVGETVNGIAVDTPPVHVPTQASDALMLCAEMATCAAPEPMIWIAPEFVPFDAATDAVVPGKTLPNCIVRIGVSVSGASTVASAVTLPDWACAVLAVAISANMAKVLFIVRDIVVFPRWSATAR